MTNRIHLLPEGAEKLVEGLRESEAYTEPEASETLVRTWHLEGLAVRPDHRMVAHTGFLVVSRRLAPDSRPLRPVRRPARQAYSEPPAWAEDLAERGISERKLRKVRRDVAHRADVEETGESAAGRHGRLVRERIDEELRERRQARRSAHGPGGGGGPDGPPGGVG